MTEQEIAQMRSRIGELEERDEEFARKSNLLLDEILLTRDQADQNNRAIAESRRDIDQLATRTGELAESLSELRQSVQLVAFTVSQVAESVSLLRQTQQTFVQQAEADRAIIRENQAETRRIWEYLLDQKPNGRGESGGEG